MTHKVIGDNKPDSMAGDELRAKVEQDIRDMFKLEAKRNDLNFALSGVERGEMTVQDYEDDLSVAISNYFTKDLLPAYTTNKIRDAKIDVIEQLVEPGGYLDNTVRKLEALSDELGYDMYKRDRVALNHRKGMK